MQLFRGSCIHNAVIAHSALLHGREWVQSVVAPVLTKFVHRPIAAGASFEVDPVRAGSEEAAERNVQNLKGAANHVIAALLENVDSLPVYAPVPPRHSMRRSCLFLLSLTRRWEIPSQALRSFRKARAVA